MQATLVDNITEKFLNFQKYFKFCKFYNDAFTIIMSDMNEVFFMLWNQGIILKFK